MLNGIGSFDADHDPLTYKWVMTSKPAASTATLSDDTVIMPTFEADVEGTYVIHLVVNDGTVDSAKVATSVHVTLDHVNAAPVADAGSAQAVKVGRTAMLNGIGSSDADGDPLTYKWVMTSKPAASGAKLSDDTVMMPTFSADAEGTYVIHLVVNDGTVDSAEVATSVHVTLDHVNAAPVADAGPNQNVKTKSIHDAGIVYLSGANSSDADKDQLTYTWSIQSGPSTVTLNNANTSHPDFIADQDGSYVVKLIVNDGTIDSKPTTVTITANINNSVPVANAGIDQHVDTHTSHNSGLVTLDATGSTDADNDTLTYKWSFASVPANSTATLSGANTSAPTFDADIDGTYVVKLIVNDGFVDATDTVSITASAVNSKPVASINNGVASLFTYKYDLAQLDASSSTDADNDTLTYTWHIKSQPTGSSATLSDASIVNPTLTVDVNGDYVVELTVNDGTVDSDSVEIRVTTKLTDKTLKDLVNAYKNDHSNTKLAGYIVNADTSEVTTLSGMFANDFTFNLDISNWNTSNVTNMFATFFTAKAFNQDISSWDTAKVINMGGTFQAAKAFNQDISSWDVSNVTNMNSLFMSSHVFNQNLSGWNVSNVTNHQFYDYLATKWQQSYKPNF
jgi:surface protein